MAAPPRRSAALGGLLGLAVLLVAAPTPRDAVAQLSDVAGAQEPTAPLVAALALLAWALAGWLLLTAVLVLAAQVPGRGGRAAAAAGRRVAPAALRRLMSAALGVTVVAGALGASPAAAAGPAAAPPAATAAGAAPGAAIPGAAVPGALDWPGNAEPSLDWPAAPSPSPSSVPSPSPSSSAAPSSSSLGAPVRTGEVADAIVVQPGDSLWSLAEQALEAQDGVAPTDREVAQAWPAWWSANRDVVGEDPDLLLPGTALQPPAPDGDDPPTRTAS